MMFGAGVPIGAGVPFGCAAAEIEPVRGLVGSYTDTQHGGTFSSAFVVLNAFSYLTVRGVKSLSCNVYIYTSEAAWLNGYKPNSTTSVTIALNALDASIDILSSVYKHLLTISPYTAFNVI